MAKNVAFSGLCIALSTVCMILSMLFPSNTLFFLCFSTVFIPLVLIKCGRTYSVFALIAACALVFIFVPDKLLCLEFCVLGTYTILKSIIEKIGHLIPEWIIKMLLYFISAICFYYFIFIYVRNALPIILLGAVIFVIYDIALSLGITYLAKKIKKY